MNHKNAKDAKIQVRYKTQSYLRASASLREKMESYMSEDASINFTVFCVTVTLLCGFFLKVNPASPISIKMVSPEIKVFYSNLVARGFSTSR